MDGSDGLSFAAALVEVPAGRASVFSPFFGAAAANKVAGLTAFEVALSICWRRVFSCESTLKDF